MDDAQISAALNRAYADILLNTSREAAVRVLAERKRADGYLSELVAVKEGAFRMLARLKGVMDSKISEAEQLSSNQKEKIEELEAQLGEAEDIVKSLREQLEMVQNELDDVKRRVQVTTNGLVKCSKCPDCRCNALNLNLRILHKTYFGFNNDAYKLVDKPEFDNPDLPSIIMRSKTPELSKNGCTQRIRAMEQNLLQGNILTREQLYGAYYQKENQMDLKEKIVPPRACLVDVSSDDDKTHLSEGLCDVIEGEVGYQELDFFERLSTKKRSCLSSSINESESREKPLEKVINEEHKDVQAKIFPNAFKVTEDSTNCFTGFVEDNMPSNEDLAMPADVCRVDLPSACGGKDDSNIVLDKNGVRNSNGVSTVSSSDGILKYTFKRKRKRVPISSHNDESAVEMSDLLQQAGNDPNTNLSVESSPGIPHITQVARQLVSLSEKQWRPL